MVCSQRVGLHSSVGRTLQRQRRGHMGSNPAEALKNFLALKNTITEMITSQFQET